MVRGSYPRGSGLRTQVSEERLVASEPWMADALCAQTDPDAFFSEKGGATLQAKRVCASCSVRAECLEYALDHEERFGIWGGKSERERRRLLHRRRVS